MQRTDIINRLIKHFDYKKYLEIGVRFPESNFNKIDIEYKRGIDPNYPNQNVYHMTSDEYFCTDNVENFDIIFIDGLHTDEQVDKDIKNSLNILNDNGTIVLHDCNPPTINHQPSDGSWNGTVWKSFVKLRCSRTDLEMMVVDADWGCGIVRRGKQSLYKNDPQLQLEYEYFNIYRKEILNLISIEQFEKKYPV